MSNRNSDTDYSQLVAALDFFVRQELKELHTALPAVVLSYNSETKRAVVQPSIRLLLTDGETMQRPPIANVPVLHPSAGGYVIHCPLATGDTVMLLFSSRGLTQFKRSFTESDPDLGSLMALSDAVAIPGFGALSITPAGAGMTIQTETGETFIEINKDGSIKITAPAGLQIVADTTIEGNLSVSGDSFTHNNRNVGDDHTHGGVDSGSSSTGEPN